MSQKVMLSDVAELNMGQSPKSEFYTDDSTYIPFLQGNRTFGYKTPFFDTYCTTPMKVASKGSVIMSVRAPVGDLNVAPSKLCLGRGVCEIKAKDGDNQYLYYVLKANQSRLQRSGNGSIFNSVNRDELSKMELKVPRNEDRVLFTEVLQTLDDKYEVNLSLIKDLEEYSQLLFHKWFVDFNFPDENGNPYKDSGGEMVEVDGKMIPKGWEYTSLEKYVSFDKGISYKSNEISDINEGLPMLNLNSFNRFGGYKVEGIKHYTGKFKDAKLIKPNDLIVACTDVTRNADIIGSPVIVPDIHGEKLLASCDIAKVKVSSKISKYYVYMALKQKTYNKYIKGFANGTNVLHLDVKGISKFRVPLPNKNILDDFSTIIEILELKKNSLAKQNKQLEETRDLLIKKLIK